MAIIHNRRTLSKLFTDLPGDVANHVRGLAPGSVFPSINGFPGRFAGSGTAIAAIPVYPRDLEQHEVNGMKRCALIISDRRQFARWLACHVTTVWPKMLVEHAQVAGAPLALDRIELSRYQLIIANLSFDSVASLDTCIFLMRILELEDHPEIVVIGEDEARLKSARSTNLGKATCMTVGELSRFGVRELLSRIRERTDLPESTVADGAPDIPGYRIMEPIAGTYSATVYRAYSERRGEQVALKVCDLYTQHAAANYQLSLRQEFDAMRKLASPFVARAYEYGELMGVSYMALEYFPRGNIGDLFATEGRNKSRIDYMLSVAKALRSVHSGGFLHLDLKPNNVMIRNDRTVALIDFGIARRIVAARHQQGISHSLGSPYFMSPEQRRGQPLDERSDIYSYGALFYRVFTGHVPFRRRKIEDLQTAQEQGPVPELGPALKAYQPIIDKTLARDPAKRFSTVDELIESIEYHANLATGVYKQLQPPGQLAGVGA